MTEIVPPKIRGLLVDIHSAALLLGYALASWSGFGFYHVHKIDVCTKCATRDFDPDIDIE